MEDKDLQMLMMAILASAIPPPIEYVGESETNQQYLEWAYKLTRMYSVIKMEVGR